MAIHKLGNVSRQIVTLLIVLEAVQGKRASIRPNSKEGNVTFVNSNRIDESNLTAKNHFIERPNVNEIPSTTPKSTETPIAEVEVPAKAVNASYGKVYTRTVSRGKSWIFNYPPVSNQSEAVRVWVYSSNATANYPILFVVEEPRGILSWQIPLALQNEFSTHFFNNVSRTLCPYGQLASEEYVIKVSSFSRNSVDFSIRAHPEPLDIELDRPITTVLSPSEPRYFRYEMLPGVDSVLIRTDSEDTVCMIMSVQVAACPVFDLLTSVQLRGRHQTVTKKGAITLKRDSNKNNTYFVVLVVTPSDFDCKNTETLTPGEGSNSTVQTRLKSVTVTIEPSISRTEFILAVLAAGLWYLGFYIMAFIIVAIYNCVQTKRLRRARAPSGSSSGDTEISENTALNMPCPGESDSMSQSATYGTMPSDLVHRMPSNGTNRGLHQRSRSQPEFPGHNFGQVPNVNFSQGQGQGLAQGPSNQNSNQGQLYQGQNHHHEDDVSSTSSSSLDESEIDMLHDIEKEKDIFRTKTFLYLSDLSRKPRRKMSKKINLYPWNLITLAVFYALPVIQLVLTYQKVLNRTGDEDTCYYNFECAHPLVLPYPKFRLTTFNNVFSNIGYVSLGILFLFIVYRRDRIHRIYLKQDPHKAKHFGVPQHFGLFYCMGIALTMMGILSACYHICPSYNNFQFDTSFMYVLAWILMLRIYQTRHPDINPHAHTAYFVLALAIFFVVIGVVYGTIYFWILFVTVYCTFYLLLSVHVYYMGRYKLDFGLFRRVYNVFRVDGFHCCMHPIYVDRLILLLIGNAVNWFFAIFGCVTEPQDFASYMLSIFIINLMMYFAFYIVMKIRSGEKLLMMPVMFTLISMVLWGFSFFFFMKHVTSWQVTPALSRERNMSCMLLKFYDSHDIWHFLSSMSMFFSFNMLLTLDDDLIDTPRDTIRVF